MNSERVVVGIINKKKTNISESFTLPVKVRTCQTVVFVRVWKWRLWHITCKRIHSEWRTFQRGYWIWSTRDMAKKHNVPSSIVQEHVNRFWKTCNNGFWFLVSFRTRTGNNVRSYAVVFQPAGAIFHFCIRLLLMMKIYSFCI